MLVGFRAAHNEPATEKFLVVQFRHSALRRLPESFRDSTAALSLNLQISARLDVIRAGLELFYTHLFEEPAALDFLRGDYLEAFD